MNEYVSSDILLDDKDPITEALYSAIITSLHDIMDSSKLAYSDISYIGSEKINNTTVRMEYWIDIIKTTLLKENNSNEYSHQTTLIDDGQDLLEYTEVNNNLQLHLSQITNKKFTLSEREFIVNITNIECDHELDVAIPKIFKHNKEINNILLGYQKIAEFVSVAAFFYYIFGLNLYNNAIKALNDAPKYYDIICEDPQLCGYSKEDMIKDILRRKTTAEKMMEGANFLPFSSYFILLGILRTLLTKEYLTFIKRSQFFNLFQAIIGTKRHNLYNDIIESTEVNDRIIIYVDVNIFLANLYAPEGKGALYLRFKNLCLIDTPYAREDLDSWAIQLGMESPSFSTKEEVCSYIKEYYNW